MENNSKKSATAMNVNRFTKGPIFISSIYIDLGSEMTIIDSRQKGHHLENATATSHQLENKEMNNRDSRQNGHPLEDPTKTSHQLENSKRGENGYPPFTIRGYVAEYLRKKQALACNAAAGNTAAGCSQVTCRPRAPTRLMRRKPRKMRLLSDIYAATEKLVDFYNSDEDSLDHMLGKKEKLSEDCLPLKKRRNVRQWEPQGLNETELRAAKELELLKGWQSDTPSNDHICAADEANENSMRDKSQ